jgi:hypothetical protein
MRQWEIMGGAVFHAAAAVLSTVTRLNADQHCILRTAGE